MYVHIYIYIYVYIYIHMSLSLLQNWSKTSLNTFVEPVTATAGDSAMSST